MYNTGSLAHKWVTMTPTCHTGASGSRMRPTEGPVCEANSTERARSTRDATAARRVAHIAERACARAHRLAPKKVAVLEGHHE